MAAKKNLLMSLIAKRKYMYYFCSTKWTRSSVARPPQAELEQLTMNYGFIRYIFGGS
jgi:hypothetical protein